MLLSLLNRPLTSGVLTLGGLSGVSSPFKKDDSTKEATKVIEDPVRDILSFYLTIA